MKYVLWSVDAAGWRSVEVDEVRAKYAEPSVVTYDAAGLKSVEVWLVSDSKLV